MGLIEQLFEKHKVPPSKEPLMTLEDQNLKDLISELNPNQVILFNEKGKPVNLHRYFKTKPSDYNIISLIGGFPHGSFTKETEMCADIQISIDPEPLETATVVGEIIYSYEQAIKLKQNRFSKVGIDL